MAEKFKNVMYKEMAPEVIIEPYLFNPSNCKVVSTAMAIIFITFIATFIPF